MFKVLGWYLGVCLAQSQGSKHIVTFQGRIRLCISPSRHSHLVSASGNSLFLPAMSHIAPGQHCRHSVGYPAWPEAPSRGTTRSPPPFSGVSMLLDPFHSIECHLLASLLISPRRRIARLRGAGHTLRFLSQLQLLVEARAAGEAGTALLRPRCAVAPGQSSAAEVVVRPWTEQGRLAAALKVAAFSVPSPGPGGLQSETLCRGCSRELCGFL